VAVNFIVGRKVHGEKNQPVWSLTNFIKHICI